MMRATVLRLGAGCYLTVFGVVVLAAPHQLAVHGPALPHRALPTFGLFCVAAGVALLSVVAFRLRRSVLLGTHVLAAVVVLTAGVGLTLGSRWLEAAGAVVLGLSLLLVGIAHAQGWQVPSAPAGALAFTMAAMVVAGGATLLVAPTGSLEAPLPRMAVALAAISSGVLVCAVERRPRGRRVARLLLAGVLLVLASVAYGSGSSLWTGPLGFAGGAVLLGLTPWRPVRASVPAPGSLRAQVSFVLALAIAAPLVISVVLDSQREERAATSQALANQRALATALAQNLADYLTLHQAAAAAVAAQPGLLDLDPEAQRWLLQRIGESFPDALAFSLFDAGGRVWARSDDTPQETVAGLPGYEALLQTQAPVLESNLSPRYGRPVIVLTVPIRDADGRFAGGVACLLTPPSLAARLDGLAVSSRDLSAYFVDDRGRAIVHPDPALAAELAHLTHLAPVAALRQDGTGALVYRGDDGQIAGYARLPGTTWGVVVERPLAATLASARSGRDAALASALLVVALAASAGALAGRWLTSPLRALVAAVDRLAEGDETAPLPTSRLREVASLATHIGQMRQRLTERAAEQSRIQEQLEQIVDSTNDAIIVTDLERRVLTWNRGAELLYGWTMEEAIGQVLPVIPPEREGEVAVHRDHIIRGGAPLPPFMTERLTRDGRRLTVLSSIAPFRDRQGKVVGILRIVKDISAYERLKDQHQELVRLEERERIARDLHDGAIQSLYAIALGLAARERGLGADAAAMRTTLRTAIARISSVIEEIRAHLVDVPSTGDSHLSLQATLTRLANEVQAGTLIQPHVEVDTVAARALDSLTLAQMAYIGHEAVANVIRHAQATRVALRFAREGDRLVLAIEDDGQGFRPEDGVSGHGLRNMQQRAAAIGGRLVVSSQVGRGTQVRLYLPAESAGEPAAAGPRAVEVA